jgi:hypothetical protein
MSERRQATPGQDGLRGFPLRLPVLVTGCGRSGTHYTTHLLQLLGLEVNHEALGPAGSVDWHLAPPAYRQKLRLEFGVVIHQYREPIKVIGSMHTAHRSSWRFIEKHCPEVRTKDPLLRAARYWIYWNRLAERDAALSFPIERLAHHFAALCRTLGIREPDPAALEAAKISVSSRSSAPTYASGITYDEIARRDPATFAELQELASRYGYPVTLAETDGRKHGRPPSPWRRLVSSFRP